MDTKNNQTNTLGKTLGLSSDALAIASKVFAASTEKLGVDGEKIFNAFAESGSFKDALGVSDEVIDGLYGRAHQQFSIGQYDRAEEIFRTLCALDGRKADFWLGLGICMRARGKDDTALTAFDTAALIQPESAIPQFHRLELLIRKEEWAKAAEAYLLYDKLKTGEEPATLQKSFQGFKTALEMRNAI